MAKTKVSFIITKLEFGGAQKTVLYTAENLDKNIFEAALICGPGGYLDKEAFEKLNNLYYAPALVRQISPFKDFRAFCQILSLMIKTKPDIVHTHSSKAGILGRLAAAVLKIFMPLKIVHTVHGFSFNDYQNPFLRLSYKLAEKLFNSLSDIVVFVSAENMQRAISLGLAKREQCRLVRAGTKLKTKKDFTLKDASAKRLELDLKTDDKIVLSIGNLKPQKNPLDMIKAAKIVCGKIPNTVFLYTGEGPLKQQAEKLIKKLKLQANFRLLGWREDTYELLNISDVFCLSSLWEGLPMALIEALSMSKPAVCYNTDGVAEVIKNEENGFLVRKGDYKTLAEKIIQLLESPPPFKNGDLKDFAADTMVKDLQQIYLNLMTGNIGA